MPVNKNATARCSQRDRAVVGRERKEEDRYSRRVSMEEIARNDYNLNISRYVSTAKEEEEVDLQKVNEELIEAERKTKEALARHNAFLQELGLPLLP